ncbi:MAG: LPS-assembly protein LptD [Formosa sp. Hel1_33_131]|nr:MAG: LPS-assembly protein LptD [Formosa sp. Hel1_33_131]
MKNKGFFYLTCLLILIGSTLNAQERRKIEIEYAPFMTFDESNPDATILTRDNSKQVHIKHEGIELWCDEAIYYGKQDFIEAYGKVYVKQGDTINMTSKYVEYSGKTQLAFASGSVVLKDPTSVISTDTLYFDRVKQQAFYRSSGKVVRDTSGTITSTIGRYYMVSKKYQFVDNVKLVNPEYVIKSNRLDFYTLSGFAFLYGPTTITSETSVIYCERGFYNTNNDTGYFVKKSKINYDERVVEGDSMYFDRNIDFASATNNITITDTLNNTVIKGHYAEVFRAQDSVFITKRALAITLQENDSIFVHSDTLMVTGKPEKRITRGYYNAKIYKSDLSGKADSIHMNQSAGLTQLINLDRNTTNDAFYKVQHPILWNFKNQITGDSIHLISNPKTETLDSLKVFNNAFVISKDSLGDGYNQMSGKKLFGLFEKNTLSTIDIIKNAETIYYLRNEEDELVGIDKSKSGAIKVWITENTIDEMRKYNQIGGKTHPENEFPENDKILQGFNWRESERPTSVEDLFKDDPPLELIKIKGLDAYKPQEDFFDSTLMERVKDARPKPAKELEKTENKAARKLPKKKFKKPNKLLKPVNKK